LPAGAAGARKLFKGIGVIALLAGAALLFGALSGGRDILQPLSGLRGVAAHEGKAPAFQRVDNPDQLDSAIRAAAGKPVMLDFYADWCVSCKEMERYTFTDDTVRNKLAGVTMLQADVTLNKDEHKALLKRFSLFGPPGIVFFDRRGSEINGLRVVGFQPADKFAATLDLALQ
jgi:thioredoxin:protein disulfide reductase